MIYFTTKSELNSFCGKTISNKNEAIFSLSFISHLMNIYMFNYRNINVLDYGVQLPT